MGLQFDDSVAREGADSRYARKRFEWLELEEQIGKNMPTRQQPIHQGPVETVQPALLARVKTEVPAYERAGREEASGQHVRAEMHVMVPINASRGSSIEAAEFRDLSRHDILERPHQGGIEDRLRQAMTPEITAQILLACFESLTRF